jgi:hypothetical protein
MEKINSFYESVKTFDRFTDFTNESVFSELPEDWCVVVTDIKGSTIAIEEGRYKDVNMVGAATIVAAQNAMKGADFPYVFGGDGATLCIPPEFKAEVKKALIELKNLSSSQFDLELRVGMLSVKDIKAHGARIKLAKFNIDSGKCIAIFRGGGMAIADQIIKGSPEKYNIEELSEELPNLDGLSCRWQPIPAKKGMILSIIISAKNENTQYEVYKNIFDTAAVILGEQLIDANPAQGPHLKYKSVWQCMKEEKRMYKSYLNPLFMLKSLEIIFAVLVFKFKMPALVFDKDKYVKDMRTHSDYRKFDDVLKFVVDCKQDQGKELRSFLNECYDKGQIYFGVHEAKESLMTCFVQDLQEGGHIHFIDGGDGGYAIAAKMLKAQVKAEELKKMKIAA